MLADFTRLDTLPNRLLLVTQQMPYIRSLALGISFRVGGRDDPDDLTGLCHLNEHMVFKGTEQLDARAISYAAESLGAELNGFTDKELTCFYSRFPSDQQTAVAELLAEIVAHPAFAPAELEKEKGVIVEEIRAADEDPDSRVFQLAFESLYDSDPLSRPVNGRPETLARMDADLLRRTYADWYHSGTCVVVAVGDVRHEELLAVLKRKLGHWQPGSAMVRRPPTLSHRSLRTETRKDLSLVYLCLSRPVFAYKDPRRHALAVLNTALGGGLSSRLFQRLRETEGLVYSVSSFAELFEDSGMLGIYFAAEASKLGRCLEVLREELNRLRSDRLSTEEFQRALVMTRSSLLLALESPTGRLMRLIRTMHLLGRPQPVGESLQALDRLTLEEVNQLCAEVISPDDWSAAAVGPLSAAEFARLLQ